MKKLILAIALISSSACSQVIHQPASQADESTDKILSLQKELADTKMGIAQSAINQGNAEAVMGQLRSENGKMWLEKFQQEKAELDKQESKEK